MTRIGLITKYVIYFIDVSTAICTHNHVHPQHISTLIHARVIIQTTYQENVTNKMKGLNKRKKQNLVADEFYVHRKYRY